MDVQSKVSKGYLLGVKKVEYKRLTKLSDLGTLHALDINGEEQPLCELTALDTDVLIGRLYELENKIESGELGDVKELKQELKAQEGAANAYRICFEEQKYWREVAERALRKATEQFFDVDCLCHGTSDDKECSTCPTTKYCERDEAVQCALNNFLKESKKELAEERT